MKARFVVVPALVFLAMPYLISGSDKAASFGEACGTMEMSIIAPPELFYITPGGVRIIRGLVTAGVFSGDLVGSAVYEQNSNINAKGNGSVQGPGFIDVEDWNGMSGTFEGQYALKFHELIVSGSFVSHGMSGDFEGVKMQMQLEGPSGGPFTYCARLLDPNAEE